MSDEDLPTKRANIIAKITDRETDLAKLRKELIGVDQMLAEYGAAERKPQPTRAEALATVKRIVSEAFPGHVIKTNDDMNPGTPLGVTLFFPNGQKHSIKAGSVGVDPAAFGEDAVKRLKKWREIRLKGQG